MKMKFTSLKMNGCKRVTRGVDMTQEEFLAHELKKKCELIAKIEKFFEFIVEGFGWTWFEHNLNNHGLKFENGHIKERVIK